MLQIQNLDYSFYDGFDEQAQNIIEKLLVINSDQRLGAGDKNGYPSIRSHPFFNNIDFDTLQVGVFVFAQRKIHQPQSFNSQIFCIKADGTVC